MSHSEQLRDLLFPLGIYDLNAPYNGGELDAQGEALDGIWAGLEELHREADLTTAEDWGLELVAGLLARKPVTTSAKRMRNSLMALLNVGGDSFTQEAINAAISGCGIRAQVTETDQVGTVEVSFPDVPGIPEGFEEMAKIIEDMIPAHLLIQYVYWYITWEQLEAKIKNWQDIEDRQLTWEQLEAFVEETDE